MGEAMSGNNIQLVKSARSGDLSTVTRLLDLGTPIESKDENGWTALHSAAYEGHEKMVAVLIKKGADINARTTEKQTPLMMAAYSGSLHILEAFLEHGAAVNDQDVYGWTPLMFVTIYRRVKTHPIELASRLLKKGADPAARNKDGWDASMMAARNGMLELEQLIEQYGPEPETCDSSLFEYTSDLGSNLSETNRIELMTLLTIRGNVNQKDPVTGATVLDIAVRNNNAEAVRVLLDHGADPHLPDGMGRTPLINAAVWGKTKALKALLSHGASVDSVERWGGTALDAARDDNNIENVRLLIEAGADLNAQDIDGNTPLMKAVLNQQTEIEELLLQSGADPSIRNKYGHTLEDMRRMSQGMAVEGAMQQVSAGEPGDAWTRARDLLYLSNMTKIPSEQDSSGLNDGIVAQTASFIERELILSKLNQEWLSLTLPNDAKRAVEIWREILELSDPAYEPYRCALAHGWLAYSLMQSLTCSESERLEEAIRHYNLALSLFDEKMYSRDWGMTHNNLGLVYIGRFTGEKVYNIEACRIENITVGIQHFRKALGVFTKSQSPQEWAMVQLNLGFAYLNLGYKHHTGDLDNALQHCQMALEVYDITSIPDAWAQVQHNMAMCHFRKGDLDQAQECIEQALTVFTHQEYPYVWGLLHFDLAQITHARYASTGFPEHLAQALEYSGHALTTLTQEDSPTLYRTVQTELGNMLFETGNWRGALKAFQSAIEIGEHLFLEATSGTALEDEAYWNSDLYPKAAYCLLKDKQVSEALMCIENGRARQIADALMADPANLVGLSDQDRDRLVELCNKIRSDEMRLRQSATRQSLNEYLMILESLREARVNKQQLLERIRFDEPNLNPSKLPLGEMLALIPPGGALVVPMFTSQGSAVFVVPYGAQTVTGEHVIYLDEFKADDLKALLVGTEKKPGWLSEYATFRAASSPKAFANWLKAVDRIAAQLWKRLIVHIYKRLSDPNIKDLNIKQVIFVPSGGLQLLPIQAASRTVKGRRRAFIDDYEVVYAPSCYALSVCQDRAAEEKRHGKTALVVGINTYESLPPLSNARAEAETVAQMLGTTPLLEQDATLEAVQKAASGSTWLHFCCHGAYAWGSNPLDSTLFLANDEPLKLSAIMGGRLNLEVSRLVTLSACETGITDVDRSPDEYIGMPAGFLQAGAPAVISSLWTVDDESTRLLMEHFYLINHLGSGLDFAAALREAQLWLRDEKGYVNPFYWAAFTFSGA